LKKLVVTITIWSECPNIEELYKLGSIILCKNITGSIYKDQIQGSIKNINQLEVIHDNFDNQIKNIEAQEDDNNELFDDLID
jgi:hypothetical protein